MIVNHVVRKEQHGAECANRLDVMSVTSCGINTLPGEATAERYAKNIILY